MAESRRHLINRHNARNLASAQVFTLFAQYRELEEAERLGSGTSTGTPGFSGGPAREAPDGQSMPLGVQGSAGSRGSLLAPHAVKQVCTRMSCSSCASLPEAVWTQATPALYVRITWDPAYDAFYCSC